MGNMRIKQLIPLMLLTLCIAHPAYSQSYIEVAFDWGEGVEIPQGGSSYIKVTVTNVQKNPVTLMFVGVRFDWLDENIYIYGSGSENELALNPGSSVSYQIYFNIPENTSPGMHSAFLLVVYNTEDEGGELEYHQVIEVKPGVNVVALVTVTKTEVVVVTVSEKGGQEATRWPIAIAAFFGLVALIVVILAMIRKKKVRG